jgi:hypothetical protein
MLLQLPTRAVLNEFLYSQLHFLPTLPVISREKGSRLPSARLVTEQSKQAHSAYAMQIQPSHLLPLPVQRLRILNHVAAVPEANTGVPVSRLCFVVVLYCSGEKPRPHFMCSIVTFYRAHVICLVLYMLLVLDPDARDCDSSSARGRDRALALDTCRP